MGKKWGKKTGESGEKTGGNGKNEGKTGGGNNRNKRMQEKLGNKKITLWMLVQRNLSTRLTRRPADVQADAGTHGILG